MFQTNQQTNIPVQPQLPVDNVVTCIIVTFKNKPHGKFDVDGDIDMKNGRKVPIQIGNIGPVAVPVKIGSIF